MKLNMVNADDWQRFLCCFRCARALFGWQFCPNIESETRNRPIGVCFVLALVRLAIRFHVDCQWSTMLLFCASALQLLRFVFRKQLL